jgi:hypothetical protein
MRSASLLAFLLVVAGCQKGPAVWREASEGDEQAGVKILVSNVRLAPVTIQEVDFGGRPIGSRRSENVLQVFLRVYNNTDEEKKYDNFWTSKPKLTDNANRTYNLMMLDPNERIQQRPETGPIRPKKSMEELLVFEKPPGDVEFLRLELPGSTVGAKSATYHLHIPAGSIKK